MREHNRPLASSNKEVCYYREKWQLKVKSYLEVTLKKKVHMYCHPDKDLKGVSLKTIPVYWI